MGPINSVVNDAVVYSKSILTKFKTNSKGFVQIIMSYNISHCSKLEYWSIL